jgi:outer membrane protein TolC
VLLAALALPLGLTSISLRGEAQPAQVAPVPSASAKVDEAPAPPMPTATRMLSGWSALWKELPKSSPDLRIALAEIERAEAATRISKANVTPTLNGSATLAYQSNGGSSLQLQLTAVATLINLRGFHAIGTAKAQEEIVALSLLEVRRKVGLALARAAAAIAASDKLARGNRVSLDLARERLGLTKKQLGAGVGDLRDLVRAQQDVAASRAVIAPSDESLIQAEEGLASLLAIAGPVGVATDFEVLENEVRTFCGASAADKERVDITIAKKQITIAERNVDDITLKFFPTLSAQASVSEGGPAFSGPWASGWSVSATLSVPLFDGGVRYGEKRDRVALVEEAKARAVQVEVAAFVERAQAQRAIAVAVAAQVSAKEARDLAAEADRLAKLAYAGGVGTNFDLIDAGRRLREAETTLVVRDLDVVTARLALPFVEGTCAGLGGK